MRRRGRLSWLGQALRGKADDHSDQHQNIPAQEPSLLECASHFNSEGDNLQEDCAMRMEAGFPSDIVTLDTEFDSSLEIFFPYVAQQEDTNV